MLLGIPAFVTVFGPVQDRGRPRMSSWTARWTPGPSVASGSTAACPSPAELFGVSTATVYALCKRGALPHVWVVHAIRVPEAALGAFGEPRFCYCRLPVTLVFRRSARVDANYRYGWDSATARVTRHATRFRARSRPTMEMV